MTATATPRSSAKSASRPSGPSLAHPTNVRERWRMGPEARLLVLVTSTLLAFGLAVLYSSSAIVALQANKPSWVFLVRQLTGVLAGAVVFAVFAKVDAERWARWAWPLMWVCLGTMLLTVLPFTKSIAPSIHGSRRFIMGGSIQPSEIAKLGVICWTAMLVVKKGEGLRRLTKGLLPFLVVVGALDVMAVLEPDLSTAMLYTLLMGIVLFAGGVRIGHFVALGIIAIPLLYKQAERLQYVVLRMISFFEPTSVKAKEDIGYQLKQSLIAVGSGRLTGVGFGQGRQQYGFLPFSYSDFIGSNVGEEWGFLGLLFVIVAFAAYGVLGFRIARQARTQFQRLFAVGLTCTTLITAYLHIGVVVGLLPTTGLTLPFFSYGRSNLLLSLLMTGVLVNIGSMRERIVGERATNPLGES